MTIGILCSIIGALIMVVVMMGLVLKQAYDRQDQWEKDFGELNQAWEKGMDEQQESYEQMLNTAFEDNEKVLEQLHQVREDNLILKAVVRQHESQCLPVLNQQADIHG